MDRESDLVIYESNDYDKFKLFLENRKIFKNKDLANSILEDNKLRYNPIIVSPDYHIIDGQHRFTIAKENNLTIYYVIDPDWNIESIQSLNRGQRAWTMRDHMEFFCKCGNKDFIFMRDCLQKSNMSLSNFYDCFCKKDRHGNKAIRSGELTYLYDFKEIEGYIEEFIDIKKLFQYYSSNGYMNRTFEAQIIRLICHPDYQHRLFLSQIKRRPEKFLYANNFTTAEAVRKILFQEVYNYKQQLNKIDF